MSHFPSGDARSKAILSAADAVFFRLGYRRTTMGDIAAAAGISRQTLYSAFGSKYDVLAAMFRHDQQHALETVRRFATADRSLQEVLSHACEVWGCRTYARLIANPELMDLIDLQLPVVRELYEGFEDLVADLIEGRVGAACGDVEVRSCARLLTYSMRGLGDAYAPVAEFRHMVNQLILMVVHSFEPVTARAQSMSGSD